MDQAAVTRVADAVVVVGEIDLATASMLSDAIAAVSGPVVIDLSGVTFMDSAGVRVLVGQRQCREASGDRFELVALSRPVQRVLEVAGVLEYFDVGAG
jgi:anti-sigma B factor antagonist